VSWRVGMRVFCSRKITLTLLYGAARLHEGHSHSKPCSTPGRTTRGASPNRAVSYAPEAHRRSLCNFHSKPCSLSLRSVAIRGTEISVSVRVGEEMKNDKLITLKLMLQRRTGSHSVIYCPFWRNKKCPASRMPFSSSRTLCKSILQPSGIS